MIGITTLEQSKRLIELNIDKRTADANWYGRGETIDKAYDNYKLSFEPYAAVKARLTEMLMRDAKDKMEYGLGDGGAMYQEMIDRTYPAWSVAALMNYLPLWIGNYHLNIEKINYVQYKVGYYYWEGTTEQAKATWTKDSLLDAVIEVVCWCLKNHYGSFQRESMAHINPQGQLIDGGITL